MKLIVNTKYNQEQVVDCIFKNFKPNQISKGKIEGIFISQSHHFRSDAYMISYLVSPLELDNFEHDQSEHIPECHLNVKTLPTFIEK